MTLTMHTYADGLTSHNIIRVFVISFAGIFPMALSRLIKETKLKLDVAGRKLFCFWVSFSHPANVESFDHSMTEHHGVLS